MTENGLPKQEDVAFRAVLHPYRSLGPKGFLLLMSFFGIVSFVAGVVFLSLGAWPVFGFFGLDVLLLYIAFKLNYRSGQALEIIELGADALTVTRRSPRGERESFRFNPYWVRVLLSERPDGRTALALSSHGKDFELGRLLTDDERRTLADALREALAKQRTPAAAV